MSTGTCKAAVKAEFQCMTDQVFPYTEDGKKAGFMMIITTDQVTSLTLEHGVTTFIFNNYPSVIFYPVDTVTIPSSTTKTVFFMTDYTEPLTIVSTDAGVLYQNGVAFTFGITISHSDVYGKEYGQLYYFCYRMSELFAEVINQSGIHDTVSGESYSLLVSSGMVRNAATFALQAVAEMQDDYPYSSNDSIINTIDDTSGSWGYLDYLTGYYFNTVNKYHSVMTMTSNVCAELDSYALDNPSKISAEMNDISAELVAEVLDHYCGNRLQ